MNIKSAMQTLIGLLAALALSTAVAMDRQDDKYHQHERGDKPELTQEQKELMSILDVDNSGVITFTEAQRLPELAQKFDELDRNNDGQLERAEFARFEVTEEHIEAVEDDDDDPSDW
jgi:Ca2+-binding EF-hand superfamily protein